MGWRLVARLVLITVAAAGCGAATQYRNERNPAANLNVDVTDCRNMSQVPTSTRSGGEYSQITTVVDEDMLARCLAERGWQPIPSDRQRR